MEIKSLPNIQSRDVTSLSELKKTIGGELDHTRYLVSTKDCEMTDNLELKFTWHNENHVVPFTADGILALSSVFKIPLTYMKYISGELLIRNINKLISEKDAKQIAICVSKYGEYISNVYLYKGQSTRIVPMFKNFEKLISGNETINYWCSENDLKFNVIFDNHTVEPKIGHVVNFGLDTDWKWSEWRSVKFNAYTHTLKCTNGAIHKDLNFQLNCNINNLDKFNTDLTKYWSQLTTLMEKYRISTETPISVSDVVKHYTSIKNIGGSNYVADRCLDVNEVEISILKEQITNLIKEYKRYSPKLYNKGLRPEMPQYLNKTVYDLFYDTTEIAHDRSILTKTKQTQLETFAGGLLNSIKIVKG